MREPDVAYLDEPMSNDPDPVHQPFTAFNQGHEAARRGMARNRNPYRQGSGELESWWEDGYDTGSESRHDVD